MKKISSTLVLVITWFSAFSQGTDPYGSIPILHDTAIQWSAESDKVVNLSPQMQANSLKKWYLDKIRNGTATAYMFNGENRIIKTYSFSVSSMTTPDWLKGLSIELPSYKNPKEWYFYDKTIPKENYERYKYRVGGAKFSADSCCGCDEADAFRAKQILNYKNGKFSIYNIFISPLCARQTGTTPIEWYPLCNVAYNNNAEWKFSVPGKDIVLLNTDEVDYEFSRENPSPFDSVLTVHRTDIGSLIYQDILKGNIKPVEFESGKLIPSEKILSWEMPSDTVPVYDYKDPTKLTEYRVIHLERSSTDFSRLRIRQDLYFDFKNERLYSVVRSVVIMLPVRSFDGSIRGYIPYCRIY